MAPSLGMGVGRGAPTWGDAGAAAAAIEDCMWEIHTTLGAGYLTPVALGTVSDFNDIWDLITISSVAGNYQPQLLSTLSHPSDECYWETTQVDAGEGALVISIRPLDV